MLKIEKVEVTGWEAAIRGMRNPMNSWEKSDTKLVPDGEVCTWTINTPYFEREAPEIGPNDLELMQKLAKGGSVHAKYRRMINVTMDIIAPLYWWKEFDTYKVGTVCNSCSTMHKIHEKEFTLDDFSCEHLLEYNFNENGPKEDLETNSVFAAVNVNGDTCYYDSKCFMQMICDMLNRYRELYLKSNNKVFWWQMIQLLPSSYNQRRTVQFNYEVLSHIYFDRKDHKLDEWHTLCDMIRELPYAKEIIAMEE